MRHVRTVLVAVLLVLGAITSVEAAGPWIDPYGMQAGPWLDPYGLQAA